MNQQEIFEFIRDNLTIAVSDREDHDYGSKYQSIGVKLLLLNPQNNEYEEISSDSFTIYKD